ncbi:MAG: hypothetical protein KDJ22_01145 [Candidatus Competibacteraceae bacterium]|nr:hypothetical protein [Candidatus Competibacteraceae bacterium]MCP5125881.1 hypothetical protein [Gammaproteobacteria bacterium]
MNTTLLKRLLRLSGVSLIAWLSIIIPLWASTEAPTFSAVALDATAFDPTRGQPVKLTYQLAQPDKITVRVYDPDGGLAHTLLDAVEQPAGSHELLWDGRDEQQQPVPDEAYTFTLETASGAIYDPTTFSGGAVGDITNAQFNNDGTVLYRLPAASRVLMRLGIHNGPLLKTLVDWKPRTAGTITESWDGYDVDHLIKLHAQKDFAALITTVALPELTVIAYGNTQESYRDYKLGRAKDHPQKPDRPRQQDPNVQLRPENLVPPAWARAPQVRMSFPELGETVEDAVPAIQEAVAVRVDVDPTDRDRLLNDQFEIIFFVDQVFFAEAERGYLPLNWRWELQQIPPGEHVLTVNISSFKGQVGVASRKVQVVQPTTP